MTSNDENQAEIDEANRQMEQLAKELEENPQKLGDEAYELAMEESQMHQRKLSQRNLKLNRPDFFGGVFIWVMLPEPTRFVDNKWLHIRSVARSQALHKADDG